MTDSFGPQIGYVAALIGATRDLTEAEVDSISSGWRMRPAAWEVAWYAVRDATWEAGRQTERSAVVRSINMVVAWGFVRYSVRDAAHAMVVADLVGQYGLTREHIDVLVGPCRTVPLLAAIIDAAIVDVSGEDK